MRHIPIMIKRSKIHPWAFAVCAFFSILFILNCSGNEEENPADSQGGPPPTELVGTWTFQSVTVNGSTADLDSVLEWTANAVLARFTIETNGAYVYEEVNSGGGQLKFESGFVYVDGNRIDINILLDDNGAVNETSTVTYTLNGNMLTLQEVALGTTIVFTLIM